MAVGNGLRTIACHGYNLAMRAARSTFRPDETYEQWRQRLLDETSQFIEWGLKHPEQVRWIPMHPVGRSSFPERLKSIFWSVVLRDNAGPE